MEFLHSLLQFVIQFGQFVIQIVKAMNIGQIKLYSNIYGVCLLTVTVRYSVGQFFIKIVKEMNIGLI